MIEYFARSYNYSELCMTALETSQHPWNLVDLIDSTLPVMFNFMVYHYLGCEGGVLKISAVQSLFQTCYECYKKFEEIIGDLHWNTMLRKGFVKDLLLRTTPFGSPAHTAVTCIYDICAKICGKESSWKNVDEIMSTLHWFHHFSCYGSAMTQWAESVLFFATDDRVTLLFRRPSFR